MTMYPRVIDVIPDTKNKKLKLTFSSHEKRLFDVRPYLSKGIFKTLSDDEEFQKVKISFGTVQWPSGQDFCPDTLYEDSVPGE